jgi:hypothetical protein
MTSLIPQHIIKSITVLALLMVTQTSFGQTGQKEEQVLFSYTFTVVSATDTLPENAPVTVSGKVIDKADGAYLPGVNIYIKGKTYQGTQTDIDGNFTLNAKRCDTLEISFISFNPQTIIVEDDQPLTISLEELPEVYFNDSGYYNMTRKKVYPIELKKRTFFGRIFHKIGNIFRKNE